MTAQWILGWWNLVFVVPFGLALLYLVAYAIGGVTFGDPDADHDLDADADADQGLDADHDADVDHDIDADADADADHQAPAGHAHAGPGPLHGALAWLGVGRVPLSILLMLLMLTWGTTGFVTNQVLRDAFGSEPWRLAAVSVPAAALAGLLATRALVRVIDRWAPLEATTARRRHDLLGCGGTAIFPIDDRFGMASVRDDRGELYQVPCRTAPGHGPVAKHAAVVLVAFNARTNLYQVIPATAVGSTGPPAPAQP